MKHYDENLVKNALDMVREAAKFDGEYLTDCKRVKDLFTLRLASEKSEVMAIAFLTNQHQLISLDILFQGTINQCSVHTREIMKKCLYHNAAAIILGHNHPSGVSTPSREDFNITDKIVQALSHIDVRVLDHIIVGSESYSFAENGKI